MLNRPKRENVKLAFGVDVTSAPFRKLSLALFDLQPAHVSPEPSWSLDRVLSFLSPQFVVAPSVQDCFSKSFFFVGIGL